MVMAVPCQVNGCAASTEDGIKHGCCISTAICPATGPAAWICTVARPSAAAVRSIHQTLSVSRHMLAGRETCNTPLSRNTHLATLCPAAPAAAASAVAARQSAAWLGAGLRAPALPGTPAAASGPLLSSPGCAQVAEDSQTSALSPAINSNNTDCA